MDAKELRVGNLVDVQGFIGPITGINQEVGFVGKPLNTDMAERVGSYRVAGIKPIPLTEEWLVELGFEKEILEVEEGITKYNKTCGRHTLQVSFEDANDFQDSSYIIYFEHDLCGYNEIADENTCEYIHQLQNLYFALTGEELTVQVSDTTMSNSSNEADKQI